MKASTKISAVAALAWLALSGIAQAQQQPSAAIMAISREIIEVKGAATLFQPVIPGVVERVKLTFLQNNPNLQKDLDAVSIALRNEYAPRSADLSDQLAKLYAAHFTEAELKELLAFYKSPLGKKMAIEEPKFVDQSMSYVQDWANKMSDEVLAKFRVEMKKRGHDL